jgi:acid phosphatase type 7
MPLSRFVAAAGLAAVLVLGCSDELSAPGTAVVGPGHATAPAPAVLVGAGDIGSCKSTSEDEKTADLIAAIPGTVFTAGDNVYDSGTAAEYEACYQPSWGRFRSRTRPSLGNHEYETGSATASFDYYGGSLGPRGKGYYSYDLGAWHIVVLNSNHLYVATDSSSAQVQWLRSDLAAHPRKCVLAIWHHPRFYSVASGSLPAPTSYIKPFWDALYAADADVIVTGHHHFYERFAPLRPDGSRDWSRGIRQFIVGTGGRGTGQTPTVRRYGSEVAHGGDKEFGVLKLTLSATSYSWRFIPVAGKSFSDSGTGSCH